MDSDIVGTIAFNPADDRLLIYEIDIDTLPQNTLSAVDSVINPQLKGPEHGLPAAANGQRYLLVESIGNITNASPSIAWGDIVANANDIIQYTAGNWVVSFDAAASTNTEYVTNLTTDIQYRYTNNIWIKSYEGFYDQGDYSIVI
jgi:hypothetical protein